MRGLHICFCSYTLLTGSRALYSAGNGNKSTEAADETWRSAQFVCIAKGRSGLCGRGQLLGPCRLASGLPLRGKLPFGRKKETANSPLHCARAEQMDAVQHSAVTSQKSTVPASLECFPLNLRERPGTPDF